MVISANKLLLMCAAVMLMTMAVAADVVPYTIKSIKPVGAGFIELVGPGKIEVNGEILDYEGTKYIAISNIDAMTSVYGVSKSCLISYSSEGYTENISVTEQSCDEIVQILESIK